MTATIVNVADTLGLSDSVLVDPFAVVSSGTTLTVRFPDGLRLDQVTNPDHYQVDALGGGVPTMVLSAKPIQPLRGSFSNGAILGTELTSNLFGFGSVLVSPGDYIVIQTAWQNVTALVVSIPSAGVAELDASLLVADPMSVTRTMVWQQYGPVTGVTLMIHEPTHRAQYQLSVSGLVDSSGLPFSASVTWTAATEFMNLLSAAFLPAYGTVLVTFSKQLMIDDALLNPAVYDIFGGPTQITVTGVRTVSPTQVMLSTLGFEAGTYVLGVDQPLT
jgi:hypothetical protein